MRERASRIRSKLTVSSTTAGTEVTLVVPGTVVYRYDHPTLFRKLNNNVRRLFQSSPDDDI